MKHFIKLSLLLMLSMFIIAGCSDQEEGEGETGEQENNSQETNTEQEEDSEGNDEVSEGANDNSDTHVEHQEGLNMGETGIVEDNEDNKYEVTLNSVEYADTVAGLEPNGETYVVANITVKNIGDDSFNANNIYEPGFGPDGELQSSLNSVLADADNVEQNLLEGEIAPEESATGDQVFEIEEKNDDYLFIIGGRGHQIITYANWDVPESEVE